MNIEDFMGERVHSNSKVKNFRWLMSDYDESYWLFYISKDGLYFADLEDYKTLQEAKNNLISRDKVSRDGDIDQYLYIRDIKDSSLEIFYKVNALKHTLKNL